MALMNPLLGSNLVTGQAPFDPTLIGNSVWLDGSADYLNRTPSSAGTTTRWIVSCWVHRNKIYPVQTVAQNIFSAGTALGNLTWIRFDDLDHLDFAVYQGSPTARKTSSAQYRDVGWYHICVSFDSDSGITASDRIKLFVNGIEVTDLSANTDTPSGETTAFNDNVTQQIGRYSYLSSQNISAYLSQFTMLENKSFQNGDLSISDLLDSFTFGTNNSQFVPKADADIAALATAAGGNSFCLDFADSADLGNDISSNANDFTPNSMSSANQTVHTPSLVYPVWNTLEASATLSNGNLNARSTSSQLAAQATQSVSSGKFYWEITANSSADQLFGITGETVSYANRIAVAFNYTPTVFFYGINGNIYQDGSSTAYDSAISAGDVIGIAVDFDAGKIWFAKNNTWLQSGDPANGTNPSATFTVGKFTPSWCAGGASGDRTGAADFGQLGFTYTPPTGFVSLNSANLTAPDYQGIDYFNATLYTGNGTAIGSGGKAVTGVGFQPEFTWIKNRDAADSHILTDIVRGVTKYMSSDSTAAEVTNTESLSTFDTDGFTVGNLAAVNTNTEDYVSWNWKMGGAGVANSDGTIASTVSASSTGAWSLITWTGTGANGTIGHGLSGAPELVIVKNTNDNRAWRVLETVVNGGTHYLTLNTTAASTAGSTFWNNSNPTASVINLGSDTDTNDLGDTMVAIAFRSVPGVCKVGKHVGNLNADGPYINLGFTPRFFLAKVTNGVNNWGTFDTARNTFNASNRTLNVNDNTVEDTSYPLDILSNGIKIRGAFQFFNDTGKTYIYLAMADLAGNGTLPPLYGR